MIIKSMSRKTRSFGQLINYMSDIEKSEHKYNVYQNIYSRKQEEIENEFQENADYVSQRRNGVYLYHEILSISKAEKLDRQTQKEILKDIAYEYAKRRAQNNLVFGTLHDDHDEHLHYHLLISSNAVGNTRKTRLSKAEFDALKKDIEAQVLNNYPELEQQIVINKNAGEKLSNNGYEQKRRTGKNPQRDLLKEKLRAIFNQANSKKEFFSTLTEEALDIYFRGKTIGIEDHSTGRKHRLKTLGLLDEFKEFSRRIELDNEIEQQPKKGTNRRTTSKEPRESTAERETQKPNTSAEEIKTKRSEEMKAQRKNHSSSETSSESKGNHRQ